MRPLDQRKGRLGRPGHPYRGLGAGRVLDEYTKPRSLSIGTAQELPGTRDIIGAR
jgi:hypothetical protein